MPRAPWMANVRVFTRRSGKYIRLSLAHIQRIRSFCSLFAHVCLYQTSFSYGHHSSHYISVSNKRIESRCESLQWNTVIDIDNIRLDRSKFWSNQDNGPLLSQPQGDFGLSECILIYTHPNVSSTVLGRSLIVTSFFKIE